MKAKKFERLIQNYLDGSISDNDLEYLFDNYENTHIREYLENSIEINYLISSKYNEIDSKAAFVKFLSEIKDKENKSKKVFRFNTISLIKYAAVLVLSIGLGYLFLEDSMDKSSRLLPIETNKGVTLTLDNGTSKTIVQNDTMQVFDENGKVIAKQKGNTIAYVANTSTKKLVYNQLVIPYGEKFEVRLSDGTVIHLNAGTTLKYPISFIDGKNREVFMEGEAFFKVAEDEKHPFIVHSNSLNIRVLGTSFNISSYFNDNEINTVLVSGKVQVFDDTTSYDSNDVKTLKPGQKASWDTKTNTCQIDFVDTDVYTGWVDGKLIFKDMPFKEIRKKLERKYNVSITNNNKALDENTFNAKFDVESIKDVMEAFSRNYGVEFKIIDNQILID